MNQAPHDCKLLPTEMLLFTARFMGLRPTLGELHSNGCPVITARQVAAQQLDLFLQSGDKLPWIEATTCPHICDSCQVVSAQELPLAITHAFRHDSQEMQKRLWRSAVYWPLMCATALCHVPSPGIEPGTFRSSV